MPAALSFIDGVHVETSASATRVVGPDSDLVLRRPTAEIVTTLRLLAAGRSAHATLLRRTLSRTGLPGLRQLYELLAELTGRAWLAERVGNGGAPLVSAIPWTTDYRWGDGPGSSRGWRLSRFAFVRRLDDQLVLESPTARAQIVLHDWRALVLIWQLASAGALSRAGSVPARLPRTVVGSVCGLLARAGFLADDSAGADEEESSPLRFWEFHDLVFHSRSRLGRHRYPYGATGPRGARAAPLLAFEPPRSGKRIALFRPSLARLRQADQTLTDVLEARRSQRHHADEPLTRDELGKFLFRSAAIRSSRADSGPSTDRMRVYPSGGSVYPLELYLAVRRCSGVEPGLYHYDPARHDLRSVASMTIPVQLLLDGAAHAARTAPPQVLILIAARFPLAARRYSSISYSLVLKEVGALMQTMYLVATAMGLGACAIGGGDADLFAKAAGIDYYTEGSVGELMLGRPVPSSR